MCCMAISDLYTFNVIFVFLQMESPPMPSYQDYRALLVSNTEGWHDGEGRITYAFVSQVPGYYPYDGLLMMITMSAATETMSRPAPRLRWMRASRR